MHNRSQSYLLVNLIFLLVLFQSCDTRQSASSSPDLDSSMVRQVVQEYSHGKMLLQILCVKCHAAPGSAMHDFFSHIFERLPKPGEEYFIDFVSNSRRIKESGSQYALELDKMYGQAYEHNFKDNLSREDFKDLITYIKIATREKKMK